jgi:hypothetical protein
MLSRLQNVSEETSAFFRRHAIVRVCTAIESPTSSIASLSLKNELFVKGEVVAACKHFLFLSNTSAVRGKVGQCQLGCNLGV